MVRTKKCGRALSLHRDYIEFTFTRPNFPTSSPELEGSEACSLRGGGVAQTVVTVL